MSAFDNCTEVTPFCPVEATTYGYYPSLPGSIVFLVVFGILTIAQIILAVVYRVVTFSTVVAIGCVIEAIGYGARIIMYHNPWDNNGFRMQVVCLILAPSFLAAGIYLTLKHIILAYGPDKSRLKPQLYTWIFIGCDAISIILQAVGGGMAASGEHPAIDIGNSVMIAGIAFQVATMFICLLLATDFAIRMLRLRRSSRSANVEKTAPTSGKSLPFYLICTGVAFIAIFIRCVYRLPEMAGGWGNPLMRVEPEFLVLDGAMIALASLLMTVAHPGKYFPAMRSKKAKAKADGEDRPASHLSNIESSDGKSEKEVSSGA